MVSGMALELILTLIGGGLVGLLSSVLGLGGGIIIVPLLTIVFKMAHTQAIATSLMTIAFITMLNTYRFQKRKMVNWRMVFVIVVFSAASSFTGGYLVTILNERLLLLFFILFVLYVLIQTLFLKHDMGEPDPGNHSPWFWGTIIGSFSGIISGTTGVGGGAIITPLLFKSRVEIPARVVPITNAVMLMNAFFALIPLACQPATESGFLTLGLIHIDRALLIFAGAIPVSVWGTHHQGHISIKTKKIFIAVVLLIILIRMGYKFLVSA